jgi:ABC-2 type transport system permease protein
MNAPLPTPGGARLPSAEQQSRVFLRMELRTVRTVVRQKLLTARILVVGLTMLLWSGLYFIAHDGFSFLHTTIPQPIHDEIVHAVFNTFFFTLMVMLVFSSSIILYGSLFRARETAYLLTLPIHDERIFLHKFQQAVLLSSWGFLLLGSPMLLAYGRVAGAPWYYYLMLLPLTGAFVYIPVGIGAIVCLEVMFRLPRRRVHFLAVSAGFLAVGAVWFFWAALAGSEQNLLRPQWFQEMLARLQLLQQRLLPSWWLSAGLLETAQSDWSEGLLFLTLLISNALFFRQLAGWTAGGIYRRAYSVAAGNGRKKRVRLARLDRALDGLLRFLPMRVRLMLIKDLRLFRRDPLQWSQFAILLGLLGLYFLNVHPFTSTVHYAGWVSMVSFMNLSVVGLLMSTFTTRFIFPMLSLEGRLFWLLGLLPLPRETVVLSKFLFAVACLLIPASLLILLSDSMLHVPLSIVGNHQLTCVILCFGLSGIAVGLGARLPNLREQSPSRIAAGFGGTLNLVLSALYIAAVLILLPLPCHLLLTADAAHTSTRLGQFAIVTAWLPIWLIGGLAASIVLGAVATLVPLVVGVRAFRRMEL